MNFQGNASFSPSPSSSAEEDFLIKQILLTHDPDGRSLDSELLLRAMENVMRYATRFEVSDQHADATAKSKVGNIEVVGSEEPLGHTIYKISREILCIPFGVERNTHAKTMALFDMLVNYRWDVKAVLVLSAFATSYGEFWLTMQLCPSNPLAASIALLKQLPNDLSSLKLRFNALGLLVKTIVDVIKCIIKFEGLPVEQVTLDNEAIAVAKSQIYLGTYWVIRSALTCSSQITDLVAMKNDQVHSNSEIIASWELLSLVNRLSSIRSHLRQQVDASHRLIEAEIHKKLLNLIKEMHIDNQKTLNMLFSSKNNLPLKDCSSQAKFGVSELINKVVILLVSRPGLFPIEVLLLLVEQIIDHPYQMEFERSYEIVWVPIPSSDTWTCSEERSFDFFSNSLPWFSIQKPRSLSSIAMKFITEVWQFKGDPLMVVLDKQGMVTNLNAIDMVLIWGARASPFSTVRENVLWEEQTWNFQLLLDGIDPLVTKWIEEGRNLCIYGSDNLKWTRDFTAKMRDFINAGLQLEMVYVGKKNPSENTKNILATLDDKKLRGPFTLMKINFFWLRLESMKRSKTQLGYADNADHILKQLNGLLDIDENGEDWVLIGRGNSTDIVELQGRKAMECLDLLPVWGKNVDKLGLVGAIRDAIEPPSVAEPCHHSSIVPFAEGLIEGTKICEKCKNPVEKFVVYKCESN